VCEFEFDVVGSPSEAFTNQATVVYEEDFVYDNYTGLVQFVVIDPAQ